MMDDQLELFGQTPFSVRLSVPEALRIFWEFYFKDLASAGPCRPHFSRLTRFFWNDERQRYLDTANKRDFEELVKWLVAQNLGPATRNKVLMIAIRLWNMAHEWKETGANVGGVDWSRILLPPKDRNPATMVPKINEREFARKVAISKEKVFRLAAFAKQYGFHDVHDIIAGLYWSRLRQSDFYRLTERNVDANHGLLQGIQHKTITTLFPSGVPFLVVMPFELKEMVAERLKRVKPGSPLFPPPSALRKKFNLVRVAAGLEYVTLQDLRRSAATKLLDSGVDPRTVAESLGHTTLRMLPSYTPRTLKHHREASEVLASTEKDD